MISRRKNFKFDREGVNEIVLKFPSLSTLRTFRLCCDALIEKYKDIKSLDSGGYYITDKGFFSTESQNEVNDSNFKMK